MFKMKSQNRALNIRLTYALCIVAVIALGLLSRRTTIIPPIAGDLLYAVMMFFIIKFLFIRLSDRKTALISLSICYIIELSQLYSATWINQLRNTTLGALVLGRGFLWSDMAAYAIGIVLCVLILHKVRPFSGSKM